MLANACELIPELPEPLKPQTAPGTWQCALREIGDKGSKRILNAGAGRGGLSWLLDRGGHAVTSVDLHPEHFVAEGLACGFADLNAALPFADGTFDTVLAVEVAEHLENPWFFLREALRVLTAGGTLVFTSPNVGSLVSRLEYARSGILPYFREESFVGCFHVTPIFPWAVARWCRTASATLEKISYSRVDWPRADDVPRFYAGGWRRRIKDLIPLNGLTGEIACFVVRKVNQAAQVERGVHYV